jgi:cysteinyl-tRNA synthetase
MNTEVEHAPTVRIYDTLNGKKEPLEPIEDDRVKMYVCGVTVYDLTHIGHARVYIFFDLVDRFLEHLGYDVLHVRNHTDVDDKIIERANEKGEDPLELADRFIDEFDRDMGTLGVQSPDHEPRVSEVVDDVVDMVEKLQDKGFAYEVDGDVFYRVENFDDYGKLSKRKLEDLEAGRSGRTDDEASEKKEHPFDFTLWKKSGPDEPAWDSPWGQGRPGWHIECSVMSTKFLGEQFDIHGGGSDLIFPHHENEIAQSEAANSCSPLCSSWMHIGMVNVAEENEEGEIVEEKMSKSLGNFWTTRDVLSQFHPEAIRYFMHTTHYRKPITYSAKNLREATGRIKYLYNTVLRAREALQQYDRSELPLPDNAPDAVSNFETEFEEALADDFNTPEALAHLGAVAKVVNELSEHPKSVDEEDAAIIHRGVQQLETAGFILGILQEEPDVALTKIRDRKLKARGLDEETIEDKIKERRQARANENYELADGIRDELADKGVVIMDSSDDTEWELRD